MKKYLLAFALTIFCLINNAFAQRDIMAQFKHQEGDFWEMVTIYFEKENGTAFSYANSSQAETPYYPLYEVRHGEDAFKMEFTMKGVNVVYVYYFYPKLPIIKRVGAEIKAANKYIPENTIFHLVERK